MADIIATKNSVAPFVVRVPVFINEAASVC